MPEYTLKVRRYQPESGEGPYWQEFEVELDPDLSVLDGLLQARDRQDGSLVVRCSCRAAICGSCGAKINGQSGLACKTQIAEAQADADRRSTERVAMPIVVEPMGNMPVVKDLVTDMESTHWEKIRRVTPWLLPEGDPPEREYVVPPESMIDVTQIDGAASSAAPASLRACRWRPTRSSSAPRRWRRPTGSSATRATRRPRSGSTTSRRTRTASTTARTASRASTPARRTSRRWTRSCGSAVAPATDTTSTTTTTGTVTSWRSPRSSRARERWTSRCSCRSPTPRASRGS